MPGKRYIKVSPRLIRHIRWVYDRALEDVGKANQHEQSGNGYTEHALPMYILAVAVAESFVNEVFLSYPARLLLSPLDTIKLFDALGEEWFERVDLKDKLILIPYVLFGQSFSKSEQPYQDMALLIRIRNRIAHYKMKRTGPRCLADLDQRGITLGEKNTWPQRLSSVQGIRWAHNTVCGTVRQLVSFIPVESYRESLERITLPSFEVIP